MSPRAQQASKAFSTTGRSDFCSSLGNEAKSLSHVSQLDLPFNTSFIYINIYIPYPFTMATEVAKVLLKCLRSASDEDLFEYMVRKPSRNSRALLTIPRNSYHLTEHVLWEV